jgi:hypothetical protein
MMRSRGAIFLAAGLLLGCGRKPGSAQTTFFPESREISGWSKMGNTRVFTAADLWQYIDGDAEKYIQAGVQKTLTADYRYGDSTDAVVDVHVMADASGSKQIMDSEPPNGSQPVTLGDAGRLYGTSLVFRKGPYLVRLVAYKDSPGIQTALVALGRGIQRKLK